MRNIKDTYLKKKKKGTSTGSASRKAKPWPLAESLRFLDEPTENRM